jgi:cytochrome b561
LTTRWALLLRVIHWITAALAVVTIPAVFAAQALVETDTDRAEMLVGVHVVAGLAILGLTLVRLGSRLFQPAPRPVDGPPWRRRIVTWVTISFYALLLALPLTGILKLTLSGLDVSAFGMALIPAGETAPALSRALKTAHEWLGKAFIALALVHMAGAMLHRRLFGTAVIRRMA